MNIDVSKGFELGCFHFEVENGKETDASLRERKRYGECSFLNHELRISQEYSPDQYHNTFQHELIEAVNEIFCSGRIKHEEIVTLANGLAQALKSLGVNFQYGGK